VGRATAVTPLLPLPLSGPVYLAVLQPGQLPGISLALRGPVSLRLDGAVALGRTTTTTFSGIPDVPLARFQLDFLGGAASPLTVVKNLCTGPAPSIAADFTGHNRAATTVTAPMRVAGCRPRVKLALRGLPDHPRLTLRVTRARGGARLRRVIVRPSSGCRGGCTASRPSPATG
jgi:hypothetical protein